jgi:hypothetical protein
MINLLGIIIEILSEIIIDEEGIKMVVTLLLNQ